MATEIGSESDLFLRTGHSNSTCHFNIGLHQLWMWQDGQLSQKIDLGFSGTRLLERLLINPGEVVSREELISVAWPERVVGQGSLNQQIYTLRQLLGDEKNREIIQTLPRRGYLFNPAYIAPAPQTLPHTAPEPQAQTSKPRRNSSSYQRWLSILLAPLGLACVIGAATYQVLHTPSSPRQQLGQLDVWLLEEQESERQALLSNAQPLLQRLVKLNQGPRQVALSQSADYYQLHCMQGASSRILAIHQSQLLLISDQQLQNCLL